MDYKILIIRNRYTKRLQLQKCFDWFKENANLNITTEEITTDLDLESLQVGNHKFTGVIAKGLNAKLKPIVPENKYNAVIFVYGNNLDGIRLNAANWEGSLYQNTELIQVSDPRWQTVNHEMFHGFFGKLSRMGIGQHVGVVDNMDTYFRDNILDVNNGDTNRVIALRTLKPYWDKIVMLSPIYAWTWADIPKATPVVTPVQAVPTVTIVREKSDSKQTLGKLTVNVNGVSFSCETLELPWLNNASNISCIPVGTYDVKYTFSPKFLKFTYQIMNVPKRSGIRIHSSNYYTDLLGCIALGTTRADINKDGVLDITNSRIAIAAFEKILNKKPFKLIIR